MAKIMRILPPVEEKYNGALARPEFVKADVVIKTESITENDVPLLNGYDTPR